MSHFMMALQQIDTGGAVAALDEQLSDILTAVRTTGKRGSVTVRIEVAPNGERGYEVTSKVSAKAPEIEFGKSFFYTDPDGHLTRQPPKDESEGMFRSIEGDKS